jgi:hypothetical protein
MANEFKHKDPGTEITQAEYISASGDGHIFACQETGDILYASSTTVLKNLGKGAANTVLNMGGSCIPAWTASPSVTDLTIGGGCITLSAATDIDLLDNNASALSFDASGKTGIIDIVTTNCSEGVKMSGTLTVGVDDTGADVKFFGASAGAFLLYDESCDLLEIRGATAAGPGHLKLTTGEATVVACDVLGKIEFQAPAECGTDAIVAGASIQAVAQDTFTASVNNTDLLFSTGLSGAATEKFRFTANGELGVGGANYGADGQVLTSTGAGTAPAWEDAAGARTVAGTTDNALITFVNSGSTFAAESNLTFSTDLSISGGNVVIATSGKGIDFAARTPDATCITPSSEVLDDYEEGAWTPIIKSADDCTSYTMNTSVTKGYYTKIGRMVYFSFRLNINAIPAGKCGQGTRLSGLPFAAPSGASYYGNGFVANQSISTAYACGASITGSVEPGTSYAGLFEWNGTATSTITGSELGSDGTLDGNGAYITAT